MTRDGKNKRANMYSRCDVFSAKLRHEEPVAMAMADIYAWQGGRRAVQRLGGVERVVAAASARLALCCAVLCICGHPCRVSGNAVMVCWQALALWQRRNVGLPMRPDFIELYLPSHIIFAPYGAGMSSEHRNRSIDRSEQV
jgi:hypothetical protein